jgi:hypothetical protein
VPIRIADNLPARRTLEAESVIVMGETEAARQDIRPLRIALLNLMPDKITTETQIARLLGPRRSRSSWSWCAFRATSARPRRPGISPNSIARSACAPNASTG